MINSNHWKVLPQWGAKICLSVIDLSLSSKATQDKLSPSSAGSPVTGWMADDNPS